MINPIITIYYLSDSLHFYIENSMLFSKIIFPFLEMRIIPVKDLPNEPISR